ncbi:putative RNA polymerase II-associated protein 1 [Tripterygium wilfordii]|uniref:Putative RNA polymerase II-associated protein 1 n=1 Tax=Tripterygium wilfordii TaxID=458696 RepID=A0A7J7BZ59_TRIWF|nr:transcriptional elongation regulator MINIYO [Tripterygium wilfordii]KAF5727128.1 putative RNA polymerase II-associated protein 1 [Tripterygium wilfordii]
MEKKKQIKQINSSRINSQNRNFPLQPKKSFGVGIEEGSFLVGNVIEKGISDDPFDSNPNRKHTPGPKPTVLPFPVARHRSHGPHWGPLGQQGNDHHDIDGEGGEDDEEDYNLVDPHPNAVFANPVQRKEKKGLNFREWEELKSSDSSLLKNKVKENRLNSATSEKLRREREAKSGQSPADSSALHPMEIDIEPNSDSCVLVTKTEGMINEMSSGSLALTVERESDNSLYIPVQDNISNSCSIKMEVEAESAPIRRESGATSLSRHDNKEMQLKKVKDMDCGELHMVEKQEQRPSSSTPVSSLKSYELGNEQKPISLESEIDSENRSRLQNMSAEEIAEARAEIMEKMDPALLNLLKRRGEEKLKKQKSSRADMAIGKKLDQFSGNTRDVWTERVEAVRELRFSLDGDVITNENVQMPDNGKSSAYHRHNAEDVTDRDFLRTEGDPSAAGYTIKEAVTLTRSVIPGQRTLALHLLASVLDKAIHNICHNLEGCNMGSAGRVDRSADWQAIWAFALGPEPELALSMRMCLDDNHSSVVLACAKVIEIIMSCDLNEVFFDISERIANYGKHICTAPVFRSKPDIDAGFLHGGFWKYSAKPSNILPSEDFMDEETEGQHTIQDDVVVAGQDFTAGLVRMGILHRIRYLLEMEPTAALKECLVSILIAIARHSPTCVNAIMKCQRLVQTVHGFTAKDNAETHPLELKSVTFLKVLVLSDRKNRTEFVNSRFFHAVTWHLYKSYSSLDQWVKSGRENCKLSSALMVEQLRFWKVCIHNGCCISYFSEVFPALCLWLTPPTLGKLEEHNILCEFTSISKEAFLVLEALARRLPNFYLENDQTDKISDCAGDGSETWSWSFVGAVVNLALKWMVSIADFFKQKIEIQGYLFSQDSSVTPLLWVHSAAMFMLSGVLQRVIPDGGVSLHESDKQLPYLPEFVPKVGLLIIKHGGLKFMDSNGTDGADFCGGSSFIEFLCYMRQQPEYERSLASVSCLHGLIQVTVAIDHLIHLGRNGVRCPSQEISLSREEKILEDGILKRSLVQWRHVLNLFMKLVASEWNFIQSIEVFGRGGPAPGVGVGWGVSGGGFWSVTALLAQTDAGFLIDLLEIFQVVSVKDLPLEEDMIFTAQKINFILGICLIAGPGNRVILDKALSILLQAPVMKNLDHFVQRFIQANRTKTFGCQYTEDDYRSFSVILASHFKDRWLSVKKKIKAVDARSSSGRKAKKSNVCLDTIHEHLDTSDIRSPDHYTTNEVVEWAHQRLPLPMHWFLSPISTISNTKCADLQMVSNVPDLVQEPSHSLEVAKCGLFFLLGIESMSTFLPADAPSPVQAVPLTWKLHSLSVVLLIGMGVLEAEKSRDDFEALQELYGQLVDEARSARIAELRLEREKNLTPETRKYDVEFLRFQSEIHESYATFIETLVDQFAAISYGDMIYGRQVAVYLHRGTEASVRLVAWNALANARALELLPPLEKCFAGAEGYLEPTEDNEGVLEAYVKSWVSGALDKAATRGSMAYALVLHHLSSFIFLLKANDKITLRNKLVRSLLRDYSRKQKHEEMMLEFIQYNKPSMPQMSDHSQGSVQQGSIIGDRFAVLKDACEGNSSLLNEVEKLRSAFLN